MSNMTFRSVTKKDYRFLYQLLNERDPKANISHKKMPSYNEHIKFILSEPYSIWNIIFLGNRKVGSIYITKQNEIGIFLKNSFHGIGVGQNALSLFMEQNPRKRFLANVNPKNKKSLKFFKKQNFKLIQYTFELIK